MKKINKKTLSFVLASFLILTFVSAGLVTYLSNTATADVTIESPLAFGMFDGTNYVDSISLGTVTAGNDIIILTKEENKASKAIPANLEITITETGDSEGVTSCDMLDSLDAYVLADGNYNTHTLDLNDESIVTCTAYPGQNKIVYSFSKNVAINSNYFKVVAVPAINMVGTYDIDMQFVIQEE